MRLIQFTLLLLFICFLAPPASAKWPGDGLDFTLFPAVGSDRFATYYPTSLYLEPGIGAGVWYQSDQLNMEGQQLPLTAFLEVSKDLSPLSYGVSYNTYSSYRQREFTLNPEYATVYARYSVSRLFKFIPPALDVFAMAGITGWRAELRDERDPQFQSAEPVQFDAGMGWMAGAGARYYYQNFGIGAQWNYFNAQGSYVIADGEEGVSVEVGSAQVQLTLSYRFRLGDPIKCPTFR